MPATVNYAPTSIAIDERLYPRILVDDVLVSRYTQARKAGAQFPPILIQKGTLRLVDGRHRLASHTRVHGADAPIACVEKAYDNEMELFLEAMQRNANQGKQLSGADMAACILKAEALGIADFRIQSALSLTPEKFVTMSSLRAQSESGTPIVLKSSLSHMVGQVLTQPQQAVVGHAMHGLRVHARQVLMHLEAGTVDWEDAQTVAVLAKLRDVLNSKIVLEHAA